MAPPPRIVLPEFILFERVALEKLLLVGELCGKVCSKTTRGTNICERKRALHFDKRFGFAFEIRYGCDNKSHQTSGWTSEKLEGNSGCRVNRALVATAHVKNMKYESMLELTTSLGMGELGRSTYKLYAELCCNAMSAVGKRSFANAVAQVRAGVPEGLLLKIAVSGDASYMTREKKSSL